MILAIFFVAACGSSSGTTSVGSSSPTTVDLSTATSLTLFGSAIPSDDFATSGDVTVSFIATDSSGAAITASVLSLKDQIRLAVLNTLIPPALAATGDISCEVTSIAGSTPSTTTTCTLDSTSTIDPLSGSSATAFLLDGSGSMSSNDPDGLRQTGTVSALEAILAASDASDPNIFSVYDFTTDYPSPLAADLGDYTRTISDWTTIALASVAEIESASSCEDGTVEEGCMILDGSATPLYQALFDLCTDMNTNSGIRAGLDKKNIVLLSDGADTGEGTSSLSDALNCLETNNITAYVIGLFESFTTTAAIEAVTRSFLDPVLTQIAGANTDRPGVYAVARNDTDLDALFASFTDADSLGYNQAVFTIDPVPAAGQLIQLSISVAGNSSITAVPVSFISE